MFDPDALLDLEFLMYGAYENPEFLQMIEDAKPFIEKFEEKTGFKLIKIGATLESTAYEPAYFFDEGIGFYTLEGVINEINPL